MANSGLRNRIASKEGNIDSRTNTGVFDRIKKDIVKKDRTTDPYYKKRQDLRFKIMDIIRKDNKSGKPINIAVIGTVGCGKSSFLNTVFTALNTDSWREMAYFGEFGGQGMQITKFLRSYPKKDYYRGDSHTLMPTFIDLQGFEDDDSDKTKALLELVFEGRIKEKESFGLAVKYFENHNYTTLLKEFNKRVNHRPVHRIVVVCTSNPEYNLPKHLFQAIVKVATKNRYIPIFGVMTYKDLYSPEDKRVKERCIAFRKVLGIPMSRFAHIMNYSSDIDSHMYHRHTYSPSVDVPVLELMIQILRLDQEDPIALSGYWIILSICLLCIIFLLIFF